MSTKDLTLTALFAAIVAALGLFPPLAVPGISVPITAQTLGVMLAGSILGAKRAGLALVVFLVIVALGVPALSGGRGGLSVFAGPSAGFLLGWPVGALVIGLLTQLFWHRYTLVYAVIANLAGGIVVVYLFGIPVLSMLGNVSIGKAFVGSMVFVPGDLVKVAVASTIAIGVRRAYPLLDELTARRAPAR